MHPSQDKRTEAAIYWSAVSLIVCEDLSIDKAAERLGVEGDRLRHILRRRQSARINHRTEGRSQGTRRPFSA
jgi:predicted HTH domain antitoxin